MSRRRLRLLNEHFTLFLDFFLVAGGEFLVRVCRSSLKLNLSHDHRSTVVSFATSAPELIVSVQGALNGFLLDLL
jgi:cation:H+ antiporter